MTTEKRIPHFGRHFLVPTVLFLAAWVLLTGDFHPLSVGVALFGSMLAVLFSAEALAPHDPAASRLPFRPDLMAAFFFSVLIQSYIAGIELIGRMISGRYRPGLIRIQTRLRSRLGRTLLANTISLIPGTLSVWMDGNHIYVHWFDLKTDHQLRAGRLIKEQPEHYLKRLFG